MMKIGPGLENNGNMCYLNSVLQSLSYCPPLVNYLISLENDHPKKCNVFFSLNLNFDIFFSLIFISIFFKQVN